MKHTWKIVYFEMRWKVCNRDNNRYNDDEGQDRGMTVNAFMSISLEPKLIAISIDHTASMYEKLMKRPLGCVC